MTFRMELPQYENLAIFNIKYIGPKTVDYTFPPEIYEITDINSILKSLLPNEVEVNVTIDDIRLGSNLKTNKTIRFTKKSFHSVLGFTQSH